MSQVFSGDSVSVSTSTTVITQTETTAVTGNFLNPPFGNAKAMVWGCATLTAGPGTTNTSIRIRRNPSAENVAIANSGAITAPAGNTVLITVQGADAIPDGRPVQYAVTVTQFGATGNGSIVQATVSTLLISG